MVRCFGQEPVMYLAPPELVTRQYEQWRRGMGIGCPRNSQKDGPGYRFPCWVCGKEGVLGVNGFGAKGLIRPRNIMHRDCYEGLSVEQRREYLHRDNKHGLYRLERRLARTNNPRRARQQHGQQQSG